MTQNAKLLNWLESHDGISTFEATLNLGICRLSERVRELERVGCDIDHDPETTNGHRIIRYRLRNRFAVG